MIDCCDGFMRLSNDEKSLIISKELKIKSKDQIENIMEDPEVFTTKLVKSNSSCKIADIQGFVYGGSTSRFWMYFGCILDVQKTNSKCMSSLVVEDSLLFLDISGNV